MNSYTVEVSEYSKKLSALPKPAQYPRLSQSFFILVYCYNGAFLCSHLFIDNDLY